MSSIDQVADILAARWARPIEYTQASLEIAAAIREAVAEEREACALIANIEASHYGSGDGNTRSACENIETFILARSEKAAPEKTDAADSQTGRNQKATAE